VVGLGAFLIFKSEVGTDKTKISDSESQGLTIIPKQQHLGKIRQGESRPFTFTVTNTSTETVEVAAVEASCGCTAVKLSERVLAPGVSATVMGELSAEQRLGDFGSTIRLTTLSGVILESGIGAHAVAILVGPTYLDLGESYLGEQPEGKTFTYQSGNDEVAWDTLKVKAEGLNASVETKGDQWEVSLQPVFENVVGAFRKEVQLECWRIGGNEPVAVVPGSVFWRTKSRNFEIRPMAVYVKGGGAQLQVLNNRESEVKVLKVEIPVELQIQLRKIMDGDQMLLQIEPQNKMNSQTENGRGTTRSGKIMIRLGNEDTQEEFLIGIIQRG
jgi:hypothetical protein